MKIEDVRKLTGFEPTNTADDQRRFREYLRSIGIDPANMYQELEMSSHFVDTHQDVSYSNAHISLHSHDFFELLYCHSSGGAEYMVGSQRYRLQRGDVVWVPPGVSHRPILPEKMDEPYVRDIIWLSQEFVASIGQRFPEEMKHQWDLSGPMRTAGTRWEYLGHLFRTGVKEAEEKKHGWENVVIGNTLIILTKLQRAYLGQSAGFLQAERRELLDEIVEYIEENYSQPMTLGDFAKRYYVSESTISHMFKQKMGVSLYRYITQRRLIAAKNLIIRGVSLENVAEQVGFSDYSSFYRAFKGEYGISPRQFRIQNGKKE